ncbi:X-linked interleukin-1 receptor accessory protein-like 2 [Pristis pectinata]|uniref:X-linked interleukin-1 receptor accessory protein-like 2 n=1 Tax=Pristis pectinata TaxID=685728 RepID=UPI00223E207D|nr:X-linked interleukin-1 receptor accessory protein-like 2 [Pristis pectinata]
MTCELNNLSDNNSINYSKDLLLLYRKGKEGIAQKINDWNEVVSQRGKSFSSSAISAADSGTYFCLLRNASLCLKVAVLRVQKLNQTGCQDIQSCEVLLIRQRADTISCPGIQHFNSSARSPVEWYQNGELVKERDTRVSLKIRNDQIHLYRIYEEDSGNYTCTFKFFENKISWLVKRTFTVNVIDADTRKPPIVIDPHGVKTIEVALGCFNSALQEYHYAFVGDPFEMTCELNNLSDNNSINYSKDLLLWYRKGKEGIAQQINDWNEVVSQRGKSFSSSAISAADSGTYFCLLRNASLCLKVAVLRVQKLNQTGCQDIQSCEVLLIRQRADTISCPGIQHFNSSARSPVEWYQNGELVKERDTRVSLKIRNDQIHLYRIYEEDSGNYTCTFKFFENKISWLVKRTFTVNVIDADTRKPPIVIDPHGVKTIEVALGCFNSALQEYHYAFVGDPFEMTCELNNLSDNNSINYSKDLLLWYRKGKEGIAQQINDWNEVVSQRGKSFSSSAISAADSGTYFCLLRNASLCLKVAVLRVQKLNQTGCQDIQSCEVLLIRQRADTISCPGIQHFNSSARSPVEWYQNGELVKERDTRVSLKIRNDQIHLYRIYEEDSGNYTCTFKFFENKISWLVKRTFTVNVIDADTRKPPIVIDPHGVKTIEVALGSSVQITCRVSFGYERNFSPVIKWLTNEGEMENMRIQQGEVKNKGEYLLIREAKLNKVTEEDFNTNFTCFSQNSQGNSSGVLRLKEKVSSTFQIKVITISTSLIFVVIVSGCVGVYRFWIEIVLLYLHYFSKDETIGDGKEFDAFVSYASSSSSGEDVESDGYFTEERFALELLPSMLENQHGYKLCLLERDILPGGIYTEDVISCIKRSRRVITVLSPNYFASAGSRLFELQTGVNSMLDNFKTKVILINFHALPHGTDLPDNVKRAIAVLPEITWKGNKSSPPSSKFWKMLKYYMPVKKKLCAKHELSEPLI